MINQRKESLENKCNPNTCGSFHYKVVIRYQGVICSVKYIFIVCVCVFDKTFLSTLEGSCLSFRQCCCNLCSGFV